ncbi:MAG: protein kinase [Cyanobacteria bacterium P01_E01_bin.45]
MTEIGQLLKSRYLISNLLSGGGFSVTYLAKDTHLPDYPDCVVKQLRLLSTDPQQVEKVREFFFNEAKMLRKLGAIHNQIPELLAYFTDEDSENFYIVQELVPGKTLKQLLGTELKLTEPEVIYILKEALEVLEFVHSYNVIHLDIKPDNLILRSRDYKIALIDFGSVKQVRTQMATANSLTPQTTTLGTPGYMPCEQSFGRPKLSSDFYALGMVAIRALTGIHPKELEEDLSTGEVLWKEQTHVRPELKALIDTMVRYHFNQRPQSASDILIELAKLSSLYPEDVTRCSTRLRRMVNEHGGDPSPETANHTPTRPSDAMRARYEMPTIVASEPVSFHEPSAPPSSPASPNPSSTRTPLPPGLASATATPNPTHISSAAHLPPASPTTSSTPDSLAPESNHRVPPAYPDTVLIPPPSAVSSASPSDRYDRDAGAESAPPSSESFSPVESLTSSSPVGSSTGNTALTETQFTDESLHSLREPGYRAGDRTNLGRQSNLGRQLKVKVAPVLVVTTAIVLGMLATWGGSLYLERRAYTSEDLQLLEDARRLADTDLEDAIQIASEIAPDSRVYDRAQTLIADLQEQQSLAQEQELLTRARELSVTDLDAALAAVNEIQTNSPLYEEAQLEGLEWQSQLLEEYLADSSQTLATLEPLITIRSDVLFLQYDGSSDDKLIGEEGIRRVTIATMSVLRSRYTGFDRLVVYPQNGDLQGMLDLGLWTSYEDGDIGLERLLTQIQVEERQNTTPDQVAGYTFGRPG